VTDLDNRPILFLDVDGPLNPFAAPGARRPDGYATHWMKPPTWIESHAPMPEELVQPLRVWLNPEHGPRLTALGYELIWATTWARDANDWIGPHLGLPELPYVEWPRVRTLAGYGVHWKTRHLVAWAAGRPFAWVDDEITRLDRAWVAEHHPTRALLHRVDAARGLRDDDFDALRDWRQSVSPA
jgi:hypothetical protein